MKVFRAVCLALALVACCAPVAWGEGFSLNEWSARGVSLAGGMVGRADDVSAIAYNAAGITQLPGTRTMGGFALITPPLRCKKSAQQPIPAYLSTLVRLQCRRNGRGCMAALDNSNGLSQHIYRIKVKEKSQVS